MLKILILDDETIARIGLLHSIDWEGNGYRIIGEASTIQQAIQICLEKKPDILFVDVILRNENGLDFIEEIQPALPLAKYILVTCTDNSEVYRRAISLHVSEFISKADMTPDELLLKLNRIADEICRERMTNPFKTDEDTEYANRYPLLNSYINQCLMQKNLDSEELQRRFALNGIQIHSCDYTIICLKKIISDETSRKNLNSSVITLCSEILQDLSSGYIFLDYLGHIIVIMSHSRHGLLRQNLERLCYRMTTTIYECFYVTLIAGISAPANTLCSFFAAWQQSVAACEQYFFSNSRNLFFYEPPLEQNVYIAQAEAEKELILKICSITAYQAISEHLEHIYQILTAYPYCCLSVIRNIYMEILNHLLNISNVSILDFSKYSGFQIPSSFIEQAQTLHELNESLHTLLSALLQNGNPETPDERIAEINQYIHDNLGKNITLSDIAEHTHYTQSHISKYYKKKTGRNLKEYILDCKIQQAILLLQTGWSVSAVAESLAFCSTSHFIHTFKSRTGETPQKYSKH